MSQLEKEGRFGATVISAELGQSVSEVPLIRLGFRTDDGEIQTNVYLSVAAWDRSMRMLEECFSFDSDFGNLEQLLGQTCSIVTELEDYVGNNGKSKNVLRVKWINPKAGPKMTEKERQSLAAQLSAKARRVPAGRKNDNPRNDPF
jgi:hypothetical protein